MTLPSMLVNNKIHKKKLIITLEEDDNIIKSIELAMRENFVSKASILSIFGKIKSGKVNFFKGSFYKSQSIENKDIIMGAGHFELSNKTGIFGNLKLLLFINNERDSFTLASGTACEGLKIEMEFFNLD
jgi:hypothetical protein